MQVALCLGTKSLIVLGALNIQCFVRIICTIVPNGEKLAASLLHIPIKPSEITLNKSPTN